MRKARSYFASEGFFIDDLNHSIFGEWKITDKSITLVSIEKLPFRKSEIQDFLTFNGYDYRPNDFYHYDLDEEFLYPKILAHHFLIHEFLQIREAVFKGFEKVQGFHKNVSKLISKNPIPLYYLIGTNNLGKRDINEFVKFVDKKHQTKFENLLIQFIKTKPEPKSKSKIKK